MHDVRNEKLLFQKISLRKRPNTSVKNASKTTLFRRNFQFLNTRASRPTFSSNVHQLYKPKSRCFMCETAVKRISFILEFLMLYEVYQDIFHSVYIKFNVYKSPQKVMRDQTFDKFLCVTI